MADKWKLVPLEPTPDMMCAAWDHTPLVMDDMTDGDFGQAYKDMLDAAPSPPVAVQEERDAWQPIETAPKDGTDVLLSNGLVVAEGHWLHDEGGTTEFRDTDGRYIGQDDSDGFIGWIDWSGGMIPAPIVWQHKPAPPAAMKGDQP